MRDKKKLDDSAKAALERAKEEAIRLRHVCIGTEHLLLGLFEEENSTASRILASLGNKSGGVRLAVEKKRPPGVENAFDLKRVFHSSEFDRAVDFASAKSTKLGHSLVGTEHLLLGIARVTEGIGAQVMMSIGVTYFEILRQVLQLHAIDKEETISPECLLADRSKPQSRVLEAVDAIDIARRKVSELVTEAIAQQDFGRAKSFKAQIVKLDEAKDFLFNEVECDV